MMFLLSVLLSTMCTRCLTLGGNSILFYSTTNVSILNSESREDKVAARSRFECATACVKSADCAAFYFADSAFSCTKILYNSNILMPLVMVMGIETTSSEAKLSIRNYTHVWTTKDGYTYNTELKFWYRAEIVQKATVHDANASCKADGANLMLIRHQADYDFLINLQLQLKVSRMYLQGTRPTESDEFVDELGRPLPFYQWDVDGINGGGLYLRTNGDYDMETASGGNDYRYICQILMN